ncbi:MAG TPA: hypothetical protein VN672_06715 [Solirubrobacteraceae bacterium]|nr:hypothetical protein [Solirubrobacteraceae bacterium]
MSESPVSLIAANALVRLAYGAAVVCAPSRRLAGRISLAPDTDDAPPARLFVRGFSAHQVTVALIGIASIPRASLRRPAMMLAAAIDAADIASAVIESRARASFDRDLIGGIVFSAAGLVSALAGSRAASPPTATELLNG